MAMLSSFNRDYNSLKNESFFSVVTCAIATLKVGQASYLREDVRIMDA
jgi:hypothetical protein